MRKAIFLDRDGVICDNSTHYYITRKEEFTLNPGVIDTLSVLKKQGYVFIMITNQGGISTGRNTHENVARVHRHMHLLLEDRGIILEEIYYCPHHDSQEACLCRKPLPLMLEKAMARFGIDPASSYFIGDSERDAEAGKTAGVQPILVQANGDLREVLKQIS